MSCTARAPASPDEALQLGHDLALGRLAPEGEAGDADGDDQQRRDREERVVRERRAQARRVVALPVAGGLLEQGPGPHAGAAASCRHIRTTARKKDRMSGPATRPTGPKVAMPPSRAKKMRPPCTSMRPRISSGFTMLSEKPTRIGAPEREPQGLGRVARHEQQEGAQQRDGGGARPPG